MQSYSQNNVTPFEWVEEVWELVEQGFDRIEEELGEKSIDDLDPQGFFQEERGLLYTKWRAQMLCSRLRILAEDLFVVRLVVAARVDEFNSDEDILREIELTEKMQQLTEKACRWAEKADDEDVLDFCGEVEDLSGMAFDDLDDSCNDS
uniref:Uncharacterized protein n=1 Tax=Chromera velia CCMP2878 TaxID=1169474 RepID=A0A0G4FHB8_9ALVE|eukprot:Cvel_16842.t1-p1 / transcript=Cvel_16842.t1 / gene=Cvel_16842 / organism=Chromera_velia_CCMP2878 / gene_product=hypothetical protein / transcript_product=hypothetical protein / location=Cvel_scaffold1317:5534-10050(+) / protein_length=148 / sequence_SO=supercontig / SO=protein_coding / is_pseudo=false